jgi:membrane protease YdiL (CAAX protease family)
MDSRFLHGADGRGRLFVRVLYQNALVQPVRPTSLGLEFSRVGGSVSGHCCHCVFFFLIASKCWKTLWAAEQDVRDWLGALGVQDIALLSLASALGEEFLFRAWLLNATGLWISSLIFGLAHFPPNRNWRAWPFFAFAIGTVLGTLCLFSGTIVWAALVHAGINFMNLRRILKPKGSLSHT